MGKRGLKAYLTVYISLTLMVMVSLCLTLIEGARRSCIRLKAECVFDAGVDCVMAEYHREVFRQYNLFYIDSSYGTDYPSLYNTQAHLEYYILQNLQADRNSLYDLAGNDLLEMEVQEAIVDRISLATDEGGIRFQKQAAQVMWSDTGVGLADELLNWVGIVNDRQLTEYNLQEELKKAEQEVENIVEKRIDETQWTDIDITNPLDYLEALLAEEILNLLLEEKVSGQVVDLSGYISARKKRNQMNEGNAPFTEELSALEKILFREYLLKYSGNYLKEKENALLMYQAEYLLGGRASDSENLANVLATMLAIRNGANVISIYRDVQKKDAVQAVASTLAAVVLLPELESLFETIIILGWAYVESLYDMKVLLAGGNIALIKTEEDWHYDLDSIFAFSDDNPQKEEGEGLSYDDYLRILLYLTPEEKLVYRFMDIMEMDIRETAGNEHFRIDGCIDYFEVFASFRGKGGFKYKVNKSVAYE